MAESSLSLEQLLGKLLADEYADLLREGLAWLARELMEAEVAEAAGAALYERSPERDGAQRLPAAPVGASAWARSSWRFSGCAATTSRASSSRAAGLSRPWSRWPPTRRERRQHA